MRVRLEKISPDYQREFLACARRSRAFLRRWVACPYTPAAYRAYVQRSNRPTHQGRLVVIRSSGELAGVVNVNEIVRGSFHSAYLGYYGFLPHVGSGYMREGITLVLRWAFKELRLHRLEANIQPDNGPSLALIRRLGFRQEGFSPRYLKVGGRWRDHERWALLAEDWRRVRIPIELEGAALRRRVTPIPQTRRRGAPPSRRIAPLQG